MITLQQLLQNIKMQNLVNGASVVCLQSTEYPLVFSYFLIKSFAEKCGVSIMHQYMSNDNASDIMASLQTTFLGQTCFYWLHSDMALTKKTYEHWIFFLRAYKGPNVLIFYATRPIIRPPASWHVIQIPERVDSNCFASIWQMFSLKESDFGNSLFKKVQSVSLDTAALFCLYGGIIGKNSKTFFETWVPSLVVPEVSLFSLSNALFARKTQQFFLLWKKLCTLYPVQFWIAFWSEQLWRACCYIQLQKKGNKLDAKKIGYRLPFVFLHTTWRTYSISELQRYHNMLYEVDYHVKNGGSGHRLEMVYAQFLNQSM